MPKKTTDKHRAAYIPFRCDHGTYETICKIAQGKDQPVSEVLRSLVADGLVRQGYVQEEDHLYRLICDAVQEKLAGPVERLAAISAKTAQTAGAAFFMGAFASALGRGPRERAQLEEAAGRARELGITYLKLDGTRDLDAFLRQGVAELSDPDGL